jgi:hypothetical protein
VTFLQTAQSLFLFRPLQKGAGSLRPGNRFRLHGIYVIEPRAKPAAAKVRAHFMSRSRRHVLVLCLVIASVTAGVAYRIFSFTSERAQVGQNSVAPKARHSAQGGTVVPVITQVVTMSPRLSAHRVKAQASTWGACLSS